jgi:hypothetical protein
MNLVMNIGISWIYPKWFMGITLLGIISKKLIKIVLFLFFTGDEVRL